jgi:Plasmid pRiA4b ORF-3-like protein
MEIEDEDDFQLSDLLKKEKDSILYEYDFGDSWEHKIVLEKILPVDADVEIPCCIKGRRACPPEDCGGVWGYQNLIEAIEDPSNPDHDEMLEWVGEAFDPEAFSIEETNHYLAEYWKQPKDNPGIQIIM